MFFKLKALFHSIFWLLNELKSIAEMNLKVELVGTKIDYTVTESAQFLSRMNVHTKSINVKSIF